MLSRTERSLSPDEQRQIDERLANATRESRMALVKSGAASAVVCGALMAATLWLSDAPRALVVGFWALMCALFAIWIGMGWRRLMRAQVPMLEDARRANRAYEIRLQASRVVEFEEEEDEGACYAFEHEPGACVFIVGQQFYEDDDFPNDDFSMVEILGTHGRAIDILVVKRGHKLTPARVVPAAVKNTLDIPEHLTVWPVSVDRIESDLRGNDAHAETWQQQP